MMNMEEEGKGCKVVIIGDGSVGKTCLLISFVENKFPAEYVPTIFDSYLYTMDDTQLTLIDTAGQEEFGELRPLSYEGTHVFIICFALNNQTSLDNLDTTWYPEVRKHVQTTRTKTWLGNILVGTKSDLRNPKNTGGSMVATEQAQAKADKYNMTYYETSALTGIGLREIFIDCVQRFQDFQETGVSKAMDSAAFKRVSVRVDPTEERREGTAIMNTKKKGKCVVC